MAGAKGKAHKSVQGQDPRGLVQDHGRHGHLLRPDPDHGGSTESPAQRGAGAGWVMPWRVTKISRAALCGWFGASAMVRIGAKQMAVPSMILHQSSRVLPLNTFVSFSFSPGHALRSICASNSAPESPACWRSNA